MVTVTRSSPLPVVLADDDPIFLAGLAQGLGNYGDLVVQAMVSPSDLLTLTSPPAVLILDPGPDESLCGLWRERFPGVPVLLLTGQGDGRLLRRAEGFGIAGYCPKGRGIAEIRDLVFRLARGETVWLLPPPPMWWPWVQPGFQELQEQRRAIVRHLEGDLSPWSRWYWRGRLRELRLAQGIAQGLLPSLQTLTLPPPRRSQGEVMAPVSTPVAATAWAIWWQTMENVGSLTLENATGLPLEWEILLPEERQTLMATVLVELDRLRQELQRQPELTADQLCDRVPELMLEWWENSTIAFLRPHYRWLPDENSLPLGEFLAAEKGPIAPEIAPPHPWIAHLWCSWILETPFPVDQTPYRAHAPEAIARIIPLGQHLVIQVANAVVGAIVNQFGEASPLSQRLYQPQWRSSRALARLRNDLSWRYWTDRHWREPQRIFESCYQVFYLQDQRIARQTIPGNRSAELRALGGWPWLLTILWELRDLLAPRLRQALAIVGRGLVYMLTHVLGRALGLIGRGILEGLGQGWQQNAALRNAKSSNYLNP